MRFDNYIDENKEIIITEIQNLVRIKSVEENPEEGKPFGAGPHRALQYMLKAGENLGFESKNFDGYAGHIEYGEGQEIVGILVHVDVVPEGDGWTYPPYSATICDGKIYGRGSYDDKGGCIAALYALKAVKDSGLGLNKKVRIIIGTNEETGMNGIPYYLSKEKEPDVAFSPDAPFPVVYGEKGILEILFKKEIKYSKEKSFIKSINGGDMVKKVPDNCVAVLKMNSEEKDIVVDKLENYKSEFVLSYKFDSDKNELSINVRGKEAYATEPQNGKNAISGMMAFLGEIPFISKEWNEFLKTFNEKIGEEYDGCSLKCNFTDDISTPLTFNIGTFSYKNKILEMGAHVRYPIKSDHEEIMKKVKENFLCDKIVITIKKLSKSHYIKKDNPLVETLMKIYKDATGDIDAEPVTMTGGTYARTLTNAVAFGPLFPGEKQVAHGTDEYVNIESIIKATKIYAQSIYELAMG